MGDVLAPFAGKFIQVPALAARHGRRLVYAAFVFLAAGAALGVIAAIAYASGYPFVVPSLGPTAFIVFNRSQSAPSRPRNAVLGHLTGAVAGYLALLVFGLRDAPSVLEGGLTAPRIGAAALSIALTSAAMILLRIEHGPAGATTLIVSLGFMTSITSLALLMTGVVLLVAEGVLIDRFVGLRVPYWSDPGEHRGAPRPGPLKQLRTLRARLSQPGGTGERSPGAAVKHPVRKRKPGSYWLVGPGEGRRIRADGEECIVKVNQARATGSYALLEVVLDPGQPATLLHVHPSFAETYWILDGTVTAEIGNERGRAEPGSVIAVPPGVPHLISCAGRTPARYLCITDKGAQSDPEFLP
jgi:CBS domain-containing membrane protein